MKYEVMRDELSIPTVVESTHVGVTRTATLATALPIPTEKEVTDLQSRRWSMCFRNQHVAVYACVRGKNLRKQLLRIDVRCEHLRGSSCVRDITLKMPSGVVAQESGDDGVVRLVQGDLGARSAKAKINLDVTPFIVPRKLSLACKLQYWLSEEVGDPEKQNAALGSFQAELELSLPATTFLLPSGSTEDDIAEFIAANSATLLGENSQQTLGFQLPGKTVDELGGWLPSLVGRGAALCNFHGIQQQAASAPSKGYKFLLVAQPFSRLHSELAGQEALPEGARVICLCACMARDSALDVRITVKCFRKDVCDDVCAELSSTFQELIDGRLSPQ